MDNAWIPEGSGLLLATLLRHGKPPALRRLIGDHALALVSSLQLQAVSDSAIGNLAATIIDPAAALSDGEMRRTLLDMLPLPKARELAARLGVPSSNDRELYLRLAEAASNPDKLQTLFSFFGVVIEERAPEERAQVVSTISPSYGLFRHQQDAAERVLLALSQEPRKVVLHMPTGSGKTRTSMHIVARHLSQTAPTVVCWLAQSSELLEQAAEEFEKAWSALGNRPLDLVRFWGATSPDVNSIRDGLLVGGLAKMVSMNSKSPQTMVSLADRVTLTVIDEAHQAIAPTYSAVLTSLYSKRPRNALLGLTATPGRTWSDIEEDRKLSDYFEGQKVTLEVEGYDDPVTYLIESGYLAKPTFKTLESMADPSVLELSGAVVEPATGDVSSQALEALGQDANRNELVVRTVEELLTRHRRVIVFAPSVENARLLNAVLKLRGVVSDVVTGDMPKVLRSRAITRFRGHDSRPMALVNFGVLTTGFDAPATSAAVIARPTKSLVLYSQMVGRATRGPKGGGNAEAEIVTIVDPGLPGFGSIADAFENWEDVWK